MRQDGRLRPGGYYDDFGGRFVAETLVPALTELEQAFHQHVLGEAFQREWRDLLTHYVGRPTPLYRADRLARMLDPESQGHRRAVVEARRSLSHRRPQDQQRPRPSAAREEAR